MSVELSPAPAKKNDRGHFWPVGYWGRRDSLRPASRPQAGCVFVPAHNPPNASPSISFSRVREVHVAVRIVRKALGLNWTPPRCSLGPVSAHSCAPVALLPNHLPSELLAPGRAGRGDMVSTLGGRRVRYAALFIGEVPGQRASSVSRLLGGGPWA